MSAVQYAGINVQTFGFFTCAVSVLGTYDLHKWLSMKCVANNAVTSMF